MSEVGEQALESTAVDRPVRLREAREAAGLHIAALAAALKVSVPKLQALEEGRYEELPDLTFARALASSACRQLRVDPAPVLAELPQKPALLLRGSDNEINAPYKPASEGPVSSPLTWLSRPAMLGAIVLLLAALVVMFLPDMEPATGDSGAASTSSSDNSGEGPAPAAPAAPAAPVGAPEPAGLPLFQPGAAAAGGQDTVAPAETGALPETGAPAIAGAATTATGATATTVGTAVAAAGPAVLQLDARQESWAEVTNGTGTVVLQRLLQAGERVEFSAAPPYSVVIGKASAVQVNVRGRALDTKALARNDVARFDAQ